MLCEYCIPIFQGIVKPHHPNSQSLEKSVAQGCPICKELLWGMKYYPTGEWPSSPWKYDIDYPREISGRAKVFFRTRVRDRERFHAVQSLVLIPIQPSGVDVSISTRNGNLPVSQSLETARRWMRLCSETHSECGRPYHPDKHPTRLLKIGATGLRLILTTAKDQVGSYAALSYCWGPPPYKFPRLTTSNMDDMLRSEIPNTTLPVAFCEAISFIQQLGIHYVWIDCLCIIQEGTRSEEDWAFESSRMEYVYSNCSLCLSLDRARSPEESIFQGAAPQFMTPFEINTTGIFGVNAPSTEGTKCAVFAWKYFWNSLYDQPLGFRAWALQERVLPRRLLGFGEGEVFWSCRQVPNACESLPSGVSPQLGKSLWVTPPFLQVTSDLDALYITWFELIEDYSRRRLTFPETDKLVAFSAVASVMERATSDQYIAGHLWKTLPQSLLWKKTGHDIHEFNAGLKIKESLNLPSWSWASVDSHISFFSVRKFYESVHTPLTHSCSFFKPSAQHTDTAMPSSVLLEVSTYHIVGTVRSGFEEDGDGHVETFLIDQPAGLASNVLDCFISPDKDDLHIEAVFCPILLQSNQFWVRTCENHDSIHGVFQRPTGGNVGSRKVYERIAEGTIQFKAGFSWCDFVKDLGMEQVPILLG